MKYAKQFFVACFCMMIVMGCHKQQSKRFVAKSVKKEKQQHAKPKKIERKKLAHKVKDASSFAHMSHHKHLQGVKV